MKEKWVVPLFAGLTASLLERVSGDHGRGDLLRWGQAWCWRRGPAHSRRSNTSSSFSVGSVKSTLDSINHFFMVLCTGVLSCWNRKVSILQKNQKFYIDSMAVHFIFSQTCSLEAHAFGQVSDTAGTVLKRTQHLSHIRKRSLSMGGCVSVGFWLLYPSRSSLILVGVD